METLDPHLRHTWTSQRETRIGISTGTQITSTEVIIDTHQVARIFVNSRLCKLTSPRARYASSWCLFETSGPSPSNPDADARTAEEARRVVMMVDNPPSILAILVKPDSSRVQQRDQVRSERRERKKRGCSRGERERKTVRSLVVVRTAAANPPLPTYLCIYFNSEITTICAGYFCSMFDS